MKVLQVNVRLQEGGAARVALDLHRQLIKNGVESQYAYGWGEKGGKSSAEEDVPHSFHVGHKMQVASNMLIHRIVGSDRISPIGAGRKRLIEAIQWADVIHLHVIHSFFVPFSWIVKELVRLNKPAVWTAHDYWMLTGRCAFTEGCEGWRVGCGSCPTQSNYPPSYLDMSSSQFKIKRKLIAKLGSRLHVVAPSQFVAQAIMEGLPSIDICVIPNWIDSEFEAALQSVKLSASPLKLTRNMIKVMIIANDLSDPTKVDRDMINQLQGMSHIEIHTIGRNSPFAGKNVVNHGRIAQRKRMVETIVSTDVALFTSEKDTFGLMMIEALACGVLVLALQSEASNEVLARLNFASYSKTEIISFLASKTLPSGYKNTSPLNMSRNTLSSYISQKALTSYTTLYKDIL